MLFQGSEMTLDKLLRGVRSLVLSSALAYSACGGGDGDDCRVDSDCGPDRVCERDPNTGERYCANPSEGEAEAEGEGEGERIPWYEGMCDDYRDLEASISHQQIALKRCQEMCEQRCPQECRQNSEPRRECALIYCEVEVGHDIDMENAASDPEFDDFARCVNEFGYSPCDDPKCR